MFGGEEYATRADARAKVVQFLVCVGDWGMMGFSLFEFGKRDVDRSDMHR